MSDLKSTILNLTRNVTKTSGDLLKTTKLSVNLSSEQEALKNIYINIGKKVHEIYMYGGSLGKFFDEQYKEIAAAEQRIQDLKERINEIKGTQDCPKCGKTVERLAEFCPKCGCKLNGGPCPADAGAYKSAPGMAVSPASAGVAAPAEASAYDKTPGPSAPPSAAPGTYAAPPPAPGAYAPAAPSAVSEAYAPAVPSAAHGVYAPATPAAASGASMPEAYEAAEPEPHPPAPPKRICGTCRAANDPGTKFCLSCGRIL